MTSLGAPEFWRLWRIQEKSKKRPGRGQKSPGKGPKEARKRPEKGQKRPQKARNPEFGEKLLETHVL